MTRKSNNVCTLVVFGAGASIDCFSRKTKNLVDRRRKNATGSFSEEEISRSSEAKVLLRHLPPLTRGLVDSLRPHAKECDRLLSALEKRANKAKLAKVPFDFEASLRDLFNTTGDRLGEQFLALRHAIRSRMALADEIGRKLPTLYRDFLSHISTSASSKNREFAIVNLNYDRLAEFAIRERVGFKEITEYVAENKIFNLYHPHGNSCWSIGEGQNSNEPTLPRYDMPSKFIGTNSSGRATFFGDPAIALPMYGDPTGKMIWPQSHYETLQTQLPRVDHVIVIGWRGADREIVELIANGLATVTNFHLVDINDSGLESLESNVSSWISASNGNVTKFSGGFRGYVESGDSPLEQLYPI